MLKLGFVNKENFNVEDQEAYHKEKTSNAIIVDRQELEAKLKGESAKAYDDWVKVKEMRDQALKCLKLVSKPSLASAGAEDDYYRLRRSSVAR